ncbi:MAG: hypothetical protein IT384_28425 [Deltaproteobacteria bacterium]|nr:hypothetical protein [Deltaproteobacteria bacterium]
MSKRRLNIPTALAIVALGAAAGSCGDEEPPHEQPFCFCEADLRADAAVPAPGLDAGLDDAGCAPPQQLRCEFV